MNKIFLSLILLTALFLLIPRKINIMVSDIGRHLKNGEIFYNTGNIIDTNYYSYTEPEFPVVNHHWLSGVVFYIVYRNFDFLGLGIFFSLIMATALYFVFLTVNRRTGSLVAVSCLLFMLIFILSRLEVRPEGFSLLFFAIYFYVLDSFLVSKKLFGFILGFLTLLQILWVNLHIFFVLGPLVISAFLAIAIINRDKFLVRTYAYILIAVILANLINPWGINGMLEPLMIFRGYEIPVVENSSIFNAILLNPASNIAKDYLIYFLITFFAGLLSPLFFKRAYTQRSNYVWLSLFIIFGLLTAKIMRFVSFYGLFGIYFFSILLQSAPDFLVYFRRIFRFVVPIGVLVIFMFSLLNPHYGLGLSPNSQNAAEFFNQNNLTGPILNNYDNGSYIIFYLFPNERVFIDGRPEAYSPEFQNVAVLEVTNNESAFDNLDENYNFNTILLPSSSLNQQTRDFIINQNKSAKWKPVFLDEHGIILVKNIVKNEEVISKFEIKDLENKLKVTKYTERTNVPSPWLFLIKLFS